MAPDVDVLRVLDGAGSLHRRDPNQCCHVRKVLQLEEALTGFKAWISGRKRYHSGVRADVSTLEEHDGRLKIDALARFTRQQIEAYLDRYHLPRHPLLEKGYLSIGCVPCTVECGREDNPRARAAGADCRKWSAGSIGRPFPLAIRPPPPPDFRLRSTPVGQCRFHCKGTTRNCRIIGLR
ncbi:phosphoadenosine phosphosulfate reductase family protein [Rhizobium sp. 007]|uniref:phosphoadenosine phosphosulfate reductase domain-containing protein n=1 Tax=Rhizobium sp. 007 TaxID=2785056 RepID=UPI001FEDBDEE|nr:phosphoadenosine phosphosulfate reductase family protein [Rhizobium sp. 007]